ncbi:NinE family protein [Escherichia coli]|uniref:NinE family protein n=1 Tax=Escherichia coli TaxID=562 RepID=UPI00102086C8|nr:NinE family protein [Escherichia coli]
MRRQRRSFTDIICENCKYLPTKRSRNKRKPIPKESDVKTFNYTAHSKLRTRKRRAGFSVH